MVATIVGSYICIMIQTHVVGYGNDSDAVPCRRFMHIRTNTNYRVLIKHIAICIYKGMAKLFKLIFFVTNGFF